MKILYYNGLQTKGVKEQFKKVEKFLSKGDFRAAQVKKMVNTNFYRAKLDASNRLLFQIAAYKGEKYILLLEIIYNHDYDKSRFLRGAEIEEKHFVSVPTAEKVSDEEIRQLVYVNGKNKNFHVLDKIISLDEDQNEIYGLPTPLIVIGSAGSGKTALTLEKMKHLTGNIAYISLSPFLVENAQDLYYANHFDNVKQEVDFLSFTEYIQSIKLPKGKEIHFRPFEQWYQRYLQTFKIKESYKLFEEFKGVLTGSVIDKPYLSREDYLNLGVKQSIFLDKEREKVYDIFEKYLAFLAEGNFYDSNIVAHQLLAEVKPVYDFVLVDEVQDLTNVQLKLILSSLKNQETNFILSGDSNQIVHPNFFSWSQLKSMFFKSNLKGTILRILKTNYRNSQHVTDLSNTLLKIKNARFGSIDKESTYLINTVSEAKGEVQFYKDSEKIKKDLNTKTKESAKFAVLVMNNEDKHKVKKYFNTPLIFSIQEAKGLEYDNIILLNFISDYRKEFIEITNGVGVDDLRDEQMIFSRAKDKTNKELEAYKFYINSLYVAITRAVKNLYILEDVRKHPIIDLLQLKETTQELKIDEQFSSKEDWLEEARKLEMQGKMEQAQAIRDRVMGIKTVSPEALENLVVQAFAPNLSRGAQNELFEYAKSRNDFDLLERLSDEVQHKASRSFIRTFAQEQKRFSKLFRQNKTKEIISMVEKYGIGFRDLEGNNGMVLAAEKGNEQLIDFFLKKGVKKNVKNRKGLIPLQVLIKAFDREDVSLEQLKRLYPKLLLPAIKVKTTDKIIKINPKQMEYFLLNYTQAIFEDVIADKKRFEPKGMNMDDFMLTIEYMPEVVLAEYRRKRTYVNSILSKNEINREGPYNRLLFERIERGVYKLNSKMELLYE